MSAPAPPVHPARPLWLDAQLQRLDAWARHPAVWVLLCFVGSRLVLEAVGLASRIGYGEYVDSVYQWYLLEDLWLDIWAAWDTGWYMDIVLNGYDTFEQAPGAAPQQLNLAFFPLYPLLVWCLTQITGHAVLSGLLLANACLLGAMWLLMVYGRERWGEAQARTAVLALSFYPNSFIFSAMYTESLFLVLLIGCMLAAHRRRWLLAGLLGALLSATRVPGIVVGLPLLWLWWRQYREGHAGWPQFGTLFLVPMGLVGYCIYLHFHAGDPLAFMKIQEQFGRISQTPLHAIGRSLILGGHVNWYFTIYFLGSFALAASLLWLKRIDELLLCLPLMLLPLFSGEHFWPLVAIPRYLLVVFPLYGVLGWLGEKRPLLCGAILLCLGTWSGLTMAAWAASLKFVM